MAIRILSDEQRARYGRFTGTPAPDTLASYFHPDAAYLTQIPELRREHNRLRFAVMLGSARCLRPLLESERSRDAAVRAAVDWLLAREVLLSGVKDLSVL
jgi:Domain of unknown function (DUF4158)